MNATQSVRVETSSWRSVDGFTSQCKDVRLVFGITGLWNVEACCCTLCKTNACTGFTQAIPWCPMVPPRTLLIRRRTWPLHHALSVTQSQEVKTCSLEQALQHGGDHELCLQYMSCAAICFLQLFLSSHVTKSLIEVEQHWVENVTNRACPS